MQPILPEMLNSSPLKVEQSTWLKAAALNLCFLLFPISRFPILLRRLKEQGRGNKITFISCNLSAVLELRSSLMKPKPQSFFFSIFTFSFEHFIFFFLNRIILALLSNFFTKFNEKGKTKSQLHYFLHDKGQSLHHMWFQCPEKGITFVAMCMPLLWKFFLFPLTKVVLIKPKGGQGDIYHVPRGYAHLPSSGLEGGPQSSSLV